MKRLQTKPSGAHITPTDWQSFRAEVVTPQFSAGFGAIDTADQWRNHTSVIDHKPSKARVAF